MSQSSGDFSEIQNMLSGLSSIQDQDQATFEKAVTDIEKALQEKQSEILNDNSLLETQIELLNKRREMAETARMEYEKRKQMILTRKRMLEMTVQKNEFKKKMIYMLLSLLIIVLITIGIISKSIRTSGQLINLT